MQPIGNPVEGTVKFFNPSKGYGFIRRPGEKDTLVHQTDLRHSGLQMLTGGDLVRFQRCEVLTGKYRGAIRATNIVLLP